MALADRILDLRRDVHSGEVLARGGDPEAHSILQRAQFLPVERAHDRYHRLPAGLDEAEEVRLGQRAVARLEAVGYRITCDEEFATSLREPYYLPIGASVLYLAKLIREAPGTEEIADALAELVAAHDGVLVGVSEVLTATADAVQHLDQDSSLAATLRLLTDQAHVVRSGLQRARTDLADRRVPLPGNRPCTAQIDPQEREKSAACPCPPPPLPASGRRH